MPSVGIVVPAYRPKVDRLLAYLHSLAEELAPATLRVELDDPDEATTETISSASIPSLEVNVVGERRGKGAAITAGFEALDTDRLAFVDADGSTAATELARVLGALDGADVAAGSRRHPEARVIGHRTLGRRLLGDGFAWIARRLLAAKLHDYQCGAKAITADGWNAVRTHLYEPGFAWDLEFLAVAVARDLDVVEVPITWEDRPGSTVSPVGTTVSMARALFVTRARTKRLRGGTNEGQPSPGDDLPLVHRV